MDINNNNFVDKAEKVIFKINSDRRMITTSKIRNILSMASIIYENAKRGKGDLRDEELADIQMLRMKLIYDSGRDRDVKNFVNESGLLNYINGIGSNRKNLIVFCRYMEALVAYHKFLGGK